MQLSVQAISLLRHIVSHTGEKEINPMGMEVDASRRLSGQESSQRRHFFKNTEEIHKEYTDGVNKFTNDFNQINKDKKTELKKANPKAEGEEGKVYEARISAMRDRDEMKEAADKLTEDVKAIREEKKEFEITDDTRAFVKKYYDEFSEKIGFTEGDDEIVEELGAAL